MSLTTMGESDRLDYVIREHEALKARVAALVTMLSDKGVLTRDERVRLATMLDGDVADADS